MGQCNVFHFLLALYISSFGAQYHRENLWPRTDPGPMDYSVINESFLVPDRGDIVRDKLKFYWRRIAFYLFTVFFVFYTIKLPSEVQNPSVWMWIIHVLYFDFCGSFVAAAFFILVTIYKPLWASRHSSYSTAIAWLINVWLHWMPPVWHGLDLFLHHLDLKNRHNIRLWREYMTIGAFLGNWIKVAWIYISAPLLCFSWRISGFTLDAVWGISEAQILPVFVPVLSIVHLIAATVLVLILKRPNPANAANSSLNDS